MTSIKTYGVRGLMECVLNIPVGKANMRVEFSGGVLTAYGNTPARYTTADPFRQAAIENSPQFRSGRITLLRTIQQKDPASPTPQPTPVSPSAIPTPQPNSPAMPVEPAAPTPMTFSSLIAARDYLVATCAEQRSALKDKARIIATGRAHGLDITIASKE